MEKKFSEKQIILKLNIYADIKQSTNTLIRVRWHSCKVTSKVNSTFKSVTKNESLKADILDCIVSYLLLSLVEKA